MKLAVLATKTFSNYQVLKSNMEKYYKAGEITEIVSGGSLRTKKLVEQFANEFNITANFLLPDFEKNDKKAETICCKEIIKECSHVIAFWDGKSKETNTAINLAKKKKIVYVIPV